MTRTSLQKLNPRTAKGFSRSERLSQCLIRLWMSPSQSAKSAFNLDLDCVEGLFGGLEVNLVGGYTLQIAGDKVRIQTEVWPNR